MINLIPFLFSCSPDYGVTIEEITTVEEIVQVYETTGDIGYEHGVAYEQAVDILFFVDESGSMADNQEQLSSTMPSIYSILTGSDFTNLQWRAGITATDSSAPIYGWVDHDDPTADLKLSTLTLLLQDHVGEAGLNAAIQKILWDTSGFFRQEADLLFVFISDEQEQSNVSKTQYESVMSQIKSYPFLIQESSIVYKDIEDTSDYMDCGWSRSSNLGTGYEEVSEVTIDLCNTSEWYKVLDPAKDHIPTLNQKWILDDGIPVYPPEDNIRVWFDDTEIFSWYYLGNDNSVNLDTVPESGVTVSIVYLIEPS